MKNESALNYNAIFRMLTYIHYELLREGLLDEAETIQKIIEKMKKDSRYDLSNNE